MLYLYGASGTTYLYIHLNNDLTHDERQPRQVRRRRLVRAGAEGRRARRGRAADRLRRRLGRRERDPSAPPLRGAPERRRRGRPVPVPEAARGSSSTGRGLDVLAQPRRNRRHDRGDAGGACEHRWLNSAKPVAQAEPAADIDPPRVRRRIERGTEGQIGTRPSAKKGDRVTIWTEEATVTRGKQEADRARSSLRDRPAGDAVVGLAHRRSEVEVRGFRHRADRSAATIAQRGDAICSPPRPSSPAARSRA